MPESVTAWSQPGYSPRLPAPTPPDLFDLRQLTRKCASLHWEFMFTRSVFGTADIEAQGQLLAEVGRLVDAGTLRTTLTEVLCPIDAATLRRAHAVIERGRARGKLVLAGFPGQGQALAAGANGSSWLIR